MAGMLARRSVLALVLALAALPFPAASGAQAAAPPAPVPELPPNAFELLRRVRAAYADLASYRDRGEIETVAAALGEGAATAAPRRRFETVFREDGKFRFVLETGDGIDARRQVLWGGASRAWHYDSGRSAVRTSPSWLSELVTLLGEGSLDALVVPALLAGGPEVLPDPSGAGVEGPVDCEGASCWMLTMTPFGGGIESRLWIDRSAHLIRRLEVRPAPGEAGPPAFAPRRPALVRVVHRVDAVDAVVGEADLAFAPPPGASRVSGWADGPPQQVPAAGDTQARFGEIVEVQLYSLTLRVVDGSDTPVRGLAAEDFRATLDGKEIPVLAADWFSSESSTAAAEAGAGVAEAIPQVIPGTSPEVTAAAPPPEPGRLPGEPADPEEGQLYVVFVQADVNSPTRTWGHLANLPYARDLLDTLQPDDRVAVVSFDSHLKLWQDFTGDRAAAFRAIGRAIRFGATPEPAPARRTALSLARHFDAGAARAAASPERALEVVGRALTPLPGEKVLVYIGWGLGNYIGGVGIKMTRDYGPAVEALEEGRATVFVLDITRAASHDLEFGLKQVAESTGGTYAKTVDFPAQAAGKLARVISGHYVLSFDVERLRSGGRLSVEVRNRKGARVLHRPIQIGR